MPNLILGQYSNVFNFNRHTYIVKKINNKNKKKDSHFIHK